MAYGSCAPCLSCAMCSRVHVMPRLNFKPEQNLALAGTIQFAASLQAVREQLAPLFPSLAVPQSRPLSPGSPHLGSFVEQAFLAATQQALCSLRWDA